MTTPATAPRGNLDTVPTLCQELVMPARKRTVRTINIRIDKAVDKALETLQAIHGDRLTISQIIRDAIIEKAQHDSKQPPKIGT